MNMPRISTYGNYASSNYGAHCLRVEVGPVIIWFSYKTPVAFQVGYADKIVRQNDWQQTTGKHLNAIDGGNKKARVSGADFERLWTEQVMPFFKTEAA